MERAGVRAFAECVATLVRQQAGSKSAPIRAGAVCDTVAYTSKGYKEYLEFHKPGTRDNELADEEDDEGEI